MSRFGYALTCLEPLAAAAAADIFALGGNAMDAVVAAAFAQAVVNPLMCGLGGDAFFCVYDPRTGDIQMLEAPVVIGSRATPFMFERLALGRAETVGRFLVEGDVNQSGYRSIMVPGFVKGLGEGFRGHGSGHLTWSRLLAPAIRLAGEGYRLSPSAAEAWRRGPARPGYPDVLTKLAATPEAARVYLKSDGSVYRAGDMFKLPDMADTLQQIAAGGPDEFYTGAVGRRIAADMQSHDGLFGAEDLAGYGTRTPLPVWGRYRGLDLASCPPPGAGPTLIQMLQMLEHAPLPQLAWNSPDYLDLLARVLIAGFDDAARWNGDPTVTDVPLGQWISADHAARRFQDVRAESAAAGWRQAARGTTHLTAVDETHLVVSLNHSTGSIAASGVVTPGLGFLYNNFLGQFDPHPGGPLSITPGKAAGGASSTIVFRDRRPVLATGAAGGSRLISAVVQSILNAIDHGMSAGEAVAVPRIHAEEPGRMFLEPAFDDATAEALNDWGWQVERSSYMGRVASVMIDPDTGTVDPGADPRAGRAAVAGWRDRP